MQNSERKYEISQIMQWVGNVLLVVEIVILMHLIQLYERAWGVGKKVIKMDLRLNTVWNIAELTEMQVAEPEVAPGLVIFVLFCSACAMSNIGGL